MSAPDLEQLLKLSLLERVELAIGLNVDCGGRDGVHYVRDQVMAAVQPELDRVRTEVVAQFEGYPGELAMLRGVLGVVRAIARHGDLGETEGGRELRRIVAEHYADERAAYEQAGQDTATAATSTPQPELAEHAYAPDAES